ncbi:MAG: DUF3854 domain-containing protein [Bacteroidales bacterium]|nr:DUF3854 domain-containing protein [Bacteroidales bacterium]
MKKATPERAAQATANIQKSSETQNFQAEKTSCPSYLEQRLAAVQITDEENHFKGVTNADGRSIPEFRFFTSDKDDNLVINYLTPDGCLVQYYDDTRNEGRNIRDYRRIRLKNPKDGQGKYVQPRGTENYPFFTPSAIQAYKAKTKVNTLFIIEGEIKAFVLSKFGLCAVGIGGIYNFAAKGKEELHPDLVDFIKTTNPRDIVILHDADALQLKDFDEEKDASQRPRQFSESLIRIYDYLKPLFKGDVYYEHILRDVGGKGIDDLLFNGQCDQQKCVAELQSVRKSAQGEYIAVEKITGTNQIRKYFGLDSAKSFYEHYQDDIGDREFIFNGGRYYYDETGRVIASYAREVARYIRVGADFYKKTVNDRGNIEYTPWKASSINADFNNSKEFVRQIPKYDGFAYEPQNDPDKYQRELIYESAGIVSRLYNRFYPLTHRPTEGTWETINRLLHHIFDYKNSAGESLYDFILDFFKLLYEKPEQKLPIICLVSRERETGKTTFLNFLQAIFQGNTCILDNYRIGSKFNCLLEGKLVVGVDESSIFSSTVEYLKLATTSKELAYEGKGKDARMGKNFAKFILCSNDESGFVKIDAEETRFCIVKVPPINEARDPHLLEKMSKEIPAFLQYLKNRPMHYVERSRLYFDEKLYRTPALDNIIEASVSPLIKNVKDVIRSQFMWQRKGSIKLSSEVLYTLTYNQYKAADKMLIEDYMNEAVKKGLVAKRESSTFYYFSDAETQLQGKKARLYVFKAEDWLSASDYNDLMKEL